MKTKSTNLTSLKLIRVLCILATFCVPLTILAQSVNGSKRTKPTLSADTPNLGTRADWSRVNTRGSDLNGFSVDVSPTNGASVIKTIGKTIVETETEITTITLLSMKWSGKQSIQGSVTIEADAQNIPRGKSAILPFIVTPESDLNKESGSSHSYDGSAITISSHIRGTIGGRAGPASGLFLDERKNTTPIKLTGSIVWKEKSLTGQVISLFIPQSRRLSGATLVVSVEHDLGQPWSELNKWVNGHSCIGSPPLMDKTHRYVCFQIGYDKLTAIQVEFNKPLKPGLEIHKFVVEENVTEIAKLLEKQGELIEKHDEHGLTPLHIAAREGKLDIAVFLLSKGADVNAKYGNGGTALHLAAFNGRANVIKLLLSKGADPTIKNSSGLTPAELAIQEKEEDAIKAFK